MKAIIKGHQYVLKNVNEGTQTLQFVQKTPDAVTKKLVLVQDGTTNEEVITMLIDRMKFLQASLPSRENVHAIVLLEKAKMWLEKRTVNRRKRKVEGTHLA